MGETVNALRRHSNRLLHAANRAARFAQQQQLAFRLFDDVADANVLAAVLARSGAAGCY